MQGYYTNVKEQVLGVTPKNDLLFIDGDYSYEGCKADWDLCTDMVKSGECVVFHDYGWAEGVKRVIHEDVMPFVERYDNLPNMWWATLSKAP